MKHFQFTIVGARKTGDTTTAETAARLMAEELLDILPLVYIVVATEVPAEKSSFVKVGGVKEWKN